MVGLVILNPSFYHPNDILEEVEKIKGAIGLLIAPPKKYKVKLCNLQKKTDIIF